MAETTGVQASEPRSDNATRRGARGSFFKRNKPLVLGGGALAVVLMLSHRGNKTGGGGTQQAATDAQAQQDALAAETAALESGAVIPPQGFGPNVTGQTPDVSGGGGNSGAGTTNSDGTVSTDPNAALAAPDTDAPTVVATAVATSTEPAAKKHAAGNQKGSKHPKGKGSQRGKSQTHANPGASHSGGKGVTVHGRTFPGATGHHVGAPRSEGGNVTQEVVVNYGGHSDRHTSVNGGAAWRDHSSGPPSRRAASSPAPRRPTAPHPAPHPAQRRHR